MIKLIKINEKSAKSSPMGRGRGEYVICDSDCESFALIVRLALSVELDSAQLQLQEFYFLFGFVQ